LAELEAKDRDIESRDRIRRIIGILRLDSREVEIHLPNYIEVAKITDAGQGSFRVKMTNPLINLVELGVEYVYINFIFSGVELFGKCRFVEQERAFVTLQFPVSLKSRTKRKYPRVRINPPFPVELKYREYPELKAGTVSSGDLPVKYSQLYWEAQRENVDIKKVFLMGLKEIRNISQFSEIVIYQTQNRSTRDAHIMRKSGKILYIDDCHNPSSYTKFIASDKIINYSYYVNERRMDGCPAQQITEEIDEVMREDLSMGYSSKVLLPLFSSGGVIGHIKVFQKGTERRVTLQNVADLSAITNLIATGIEKSKFAGDLNEIVDSKLIDISEGGLLLKIDNSMGGVRIPRGTNIEMKFRIRDIEIVMKGSVCREDREEACFAVQFVDVEPDTKSMLKSFINETIEKIKNQQ
jgi:hypothetical protein